MRTYAYPVFLAVVVHVAIALAFTLGWQQPTPARDPILPVAVRASLVRMVDVRPEKPAPKPAPARTPVEPVRMRPLPTPAVVPKTVPRAEPVAAPVPAPAEPAPPRVDPDRAARDALALEALENALQEEARALAARDGVEAQDEVEAFAAGIAAMVERSWSRPPSARNGMQAVIVIDLVPTGEVVGVHLVTPSGDPPFDASAERAVWRAGRFEVPSDSATFERYFRRFRLVFRPEDLMR